MTTGWNWISIFAGIASISTLILGILGIIQLSGIRNSIRSASLANVITLEQSIADRRQRIAEISREIATDPNPDSESTKQLTNALREAIENYLNVLDRLCASMRRGVIPEADYRCDYAALLKSVVKDYGKDFNISTRYQNIQFLSEKWAKHPLSRCKK